MIPSNPAGRVCRQTKILVDIRPFRSSLCNGLSVYSFHLARKLVELLGERITCLQGFDSPGVGSAPPVRLRPPDFDLGGDERALRTLTAISGFRSLLSTYYPVPTSRALSSVQVVHDLIPLRMPEIYGGTPIFSFYNSHIRRSCQAASHVITDSQQTRSDVMELFGIPSAKVTVVHPGADHLTGIDSREPPKELLDALKGRPYLLAVSSSDKRKNLENLRAAHGILSRRLCPRKLTLVLAVADGGAAVASPPLGGEDDGAPVVQTGPLSTAELIWLFRRSEAFVFPSFYEGFGLPVAEAMSLGVPIATSNRSCLPEVAGDAALYFDPSSPEAIAATLHSLIEDASVRRELSDRGLKRSRRFTWERAARSIGEILLDLAAG